MFALPTLPGCYKPNQLAVILDISRCTLAEKSAVCRVAAARKMLNQGDVLKLVPAAAA